VNVLQCDPTWQTDPNGSGNYSNLPNSPIQIYTDISSSQLTDAIDVAKNSWNNVSTGPTFTPTPNDCGTGATCVKVIEDKTLPPNICGQGSFGTDSSGQINGNVVIKLNTNWPSYGSHLARLLAHELGHMLGLGNQDICSAEESVMKDGIPCNASVTNIVTQNDSVPVNNTVYGTGPRTSCGF